MAMLIISATQIHLCKLTLYREIFSTKGAFVLDENDFRKSFSPKPACLAVTENDIFRKMTSG